MGNENLAQKLIPKLASEHWVKNKMKNKTWALQRLQSPNDNHDDNDNENRHENDDSFQTWDPRPPRIQGARSPTRREQEPGSLSQPGAHLITNEISIFKFSSWILECYVVGQPPACPFCQCHAY